MDKETLIEAVYDLLVDDIQKGDSTVLFELLNFVPVKNLIGTLPEERWSEFQEKDILEACPVWLTEEIKEEVRNIWNSHKETDDGLRVKAVKTLIGYSKANGYQIGLSKAMELLKNYCIS